MATSPWYRGGTAKFTNGSTTVTGTDTEWVRFVRAGDGIQGPDGKLYQVTNVESSTSMSITPAYGSETAYWTIPIQGYVKQLADTAAQLVRDFGDAAEAVADFDNLHNTLITEANRAEDARDSAINAASSASGHASNSLAYSQESERFASAASIAASTSSGIWRPTLTSLRSVTDQPTNTMGVVYASANPSQNGWYVWTGTEWEKAELQPVDQGSIGEFGVSATFVTDFNTISISGVYRAPDGGAPAEGSPEPLSRILVEHIEGFQGRARQTAYGAVNSEYVWTRARGSDGVWSDWVEMITRASLGAYAPEATFAQDWNLISESGIYRSNLNGAVAEGSPGFAHMTVQHVEQGDRQGVGGRAWQRATSSSLTLPQEFTRTRDEVGVWGEWIETLQMPRLISSVSGSQSLSDYKSAGDSIDAFASVLPGGELVAPALASGNPGRLAASESGRIISRSRFTPHAGIFLISVMAWATPVADDLIVELLGYNAMGDTVTETKAIGTLTPEQAWGLYVVRFPDSNPRTYALSLRSTNGRRIAVGSMGVRRYDGVFREGETKITAEAARKSLYRTILLFGADKVFDIDVGRLDFSSDYITRTDSGQQTVMASRESIIKAGTSFQIVFDSTSENTEAIFHQHSASSPGRLQVYVNRASSTGVQREYINVFIGGAKPALPPMPYRPGEKVCFTIDVDTENNVELYLGKRLWGRSVAADGVLDIGMSFFGGGGLQGRPNTRIYSVSCVDYEDRGVHRAAALDQPFLIPTSFFTENTGRYAAELGSGVIRTWKGYESIPPASLTKVISALVILDRAQLDEEVEVLAEDATGGSGNNLQTGDVLTLEALLYDMMLPSSNVAASVAARYVGGSVSTFVGWMNEKAAAMGMNDTLFINPHGLGAKGQMTTPNDMLRLCKAASNYPQLQPIWGAAKHTIEITGANARSINLTSSVKMVNDEGVVGGKTGTLSGGYNNLMIHAKMPDGTPFWGVVLQASTNENRYIGMRQCLDAARRFARQEVFV